MNLAHGQGHRICLLTPGQPSTNPRLVKEADALAEAGYQVEVISAYWSDWADAADRHLLAGRRWPCRYVGGHPGHSRSRFAWTRIRHFLGRRLAAHLASPSRLQLAAVGRVAPDLMRAAVQVPADLYIAHNLPALPAAVLAARQNRARAGYDAEDLVLDGLESGKSLSPSQRLLQVFLPQCDYVTAASAGMASAYAERYGSRVEPVVIQNVFPLHMRPSSFPERPPDTPLSLYWFSQTIGANRGLESVLESMARAASPVHFHLRGVWQKGYREKFYSRAAALQIPRESLFWHPPAPPDEMARLASQYDIGLAVEPGRDENNDLTISNKIFTYLLAGNAVVATRTRGQEELCRQLGEAAFCFNHANPRELAARLDQWSRDPAALETARRRAWQLGEERFNWDCEKRHFLNTIGESLGNA